MHQKPHSHQYTTNTTKKHSPRTSASLPIKPTQWQCGVCHSEYSVSEPYCIQCYQSLYYNYYMQGFLFVEKDQQQSGYYEQIDEYSFQRDQQQNRNFHNLQSQNVRQKKYSNQYKNKNKKQSQYVNNNRNLILQNKTNLLWIQKVLLAD